VQSWFGLWKNLSHPLACPQISYNGSASKVGTVLLGTRSNHTNPIQETDFMSRFTSRPVLSLPVLSLAAAALFAFAANATAQSAAPQAASAAAAATQQPASTPHDPAHYTRDEQIKLDWPWLGSFRQADAELGLPAAGQTRVVFMGDSITHGWHLDQSFPSKPYINRGISGQTSPQMVLRFHQDVIQLKPAVVIILAGTNDVAQNTGPISPEETLNNIAAMAEMATANGIHVVLCSITPSFDFGWHPGLEPAPKIAALNKLIQAYAKAHGYVYVDYYSAMKDDRGGLPKTLSKDGVHPLPAGYAVMAPLAQVGIDAALKAK
jgi:acyl-CoA thioesterase-1